MLQQDRPDDYVIATGVKHSVRSFVDKVFSTVGLDWKDYVEFDPRYLRPTEVDQLVGDPSKARKKLGWQPRTGFDELVRIMVEADLAAENQLHHLRNVPPRVVSAARPAAG
jgi:GDPmannose 4,6-dehydratase